MLSPGTVWEKNTMHNNRGELTVLNGCAHMLRCWVSEELGVSLRMLLLGKSRGS